MKKNEVESLPYVTYKNYLKIDFKNSKFKSPNFKTLRTLSGKSSCVWIHQWILQYDKDTDNSSLKK